MCTILHNAGLSLCNSLWCLQTKSDKLCHHLQFDIKIQSQPPNLLFSHIVYYILQTTLTKLYYISPHQKFLKIYRSTLTNEHQHSSLREVVGTKQSSDKMQSTLNQKSPRSADRVHVASIWMAHTKNGVFQVTESHGFNSQ